MRVDDAFYIETIGIVPVCPGECEAFLILPRRLAW